MPFQLRDYRNYEWVTLSREAFTDHAAARVRAADLLASGEAEMIAVCAPGDAGHMGRIVAVLTACESRGARPTEWPGVWEWGPPAGRPAA
jgi:hypothetical protein